MTVMDDPARISAVRYVLDHPVPPLVNALIRTLAIEIQVPWAAATVLDLTLQHFLAVSDGPMISCARDGSRCQYVIKSGHMVAINSVHETPWHRMGRVFLPAGVEIKAYLGVPLKDTKGLILGAICVVDSEPRVWTADEHYALHRTSTHVTNVLATGKP